MSTKPVLAVTGATGAQGGGLVQAALTDPEKRFAVRALTRDPGSQKSRALAAQGAEVVAADYDRPETLDAAFEGVWGAFVVTNFWDHMIGGRELDQLAALARATGRSDIRHVVYSTLEDTRQQIPLEDPRMPVLQERFNIPHFDAKGEADAIFAAEGAPTSYLLAAFYWDNFIHFGAGPHRGEDGRLVLGMPLGGAKLPGIAASDIGACALGVFRLGESAIGERYGISGEILSGDELAAAMERSVGEPVSFYDVPFDDYRGLGFPGAMELGNMFQHHQILGEDFRAARSPEVARRLHPGLQNFATWLERNAARIPLG